MRRRVYGQTWPSRWLRLSGMIDETRTSEVFETGLKKLQFELKSQLASHGLYGVVSDVPVNHNSSPMSAVNIEVAVKGRVASRSFERRQIEGCYLRVSGEVLKGVISLVNELAAA
jgi:hypothetical protein